MDNPNPSKPNGASKPQKPQLSPFQEGVKKAVRSYGEQQAMEALSQGIPPQHIEQEAGLSPQEVLKQLRDLSQEQMPVQTGDDLFSGRVGLVGAILNGVQGKGFNPMAVKTQSIGLDNAAQLLALSQTMNKGAMDAQKQPLEVKKLGLDIKKGELDLQQADPDFQKQKLTEEEAIRSEARVYEDSIKALNKDIKSSSSILNGLDSLQSASLALGDFKTGVLSQVAARGDAAVKQFAKDPKYTEYVASINRELNRFARVYAQEKGNIANEDIERYRKALTSITTPIATKLKMLREIESVVKKDLLASAEIAKTDEAGIGKISPTLGKRLGKIKDGGVLQSDAQGNLAYVYPDGTFEEVK